MRLFFIICALFFSLSAQGQVKYYLGMDVYSGVRNRDTLRVDSNAYFMNNVGIGTVTPTFNFQVDGTYAMIDNLSNGLKYEEGISSNVISTGIKGFASYYGESLTGKRTILAMGDLTTAGTVNYDALILHVDTANKFQNSFGILNNTSEVAMSSTATDAIQKSSLASYKDRIVIQSVTTADTLVFKIDSVYDFQSTYGAVLFPRMTTTQRDAITAVNGMMIYNTTTNQFEFYENGSWVSK